MTETKTKREDRPKNFRLSPALRSAIRRAATEAGQTDSGWIRAAAPSGTPAEKCLLAGDS